MYVALQLLCEVLDQLGISCSGERLGDSLHACEVSDHTVLAAEDSVVDSDREDFLLIA